MAEAIDYVESQLAMKVYVEDGMAQGVAKVLSEQSYAENVEIETGEQMLDQISFIFEGSEHLLHAFTDGSVADAVKFQVKDQGHAEALQQNLAQVDGIVKVIYPQQMAQILSTWIQRIELYGAFAIVLFIAVAFLMVYSSFRLALFQRAKELKIKLFLGMDPKIVRAQFLLEGIVLGFFGALLAIIFVWGLYGFVFKPIQAAIPYLGQLSIDQVILACVIQLVMGAILGLTASYFSTRKMIRHV